MNTSAGENSNGSRDDNSHGDKPRVKTWKIIVGLALLSPIIAVQWLLHSSAVLRFAIEKAEEMAAGLTVDNFSGSIADGLSLDASFSDQQNSYRVNNLQINLDLNCLWRLDVCVELLSVDEVIIALTSSEEEKEKQAIVLPAVELPVNIRINQFHVGRLAVMMDEQPVYTINQIDAALSLIDGQLSLSDFTASDDYCAWQINSTVMLNNEYPINGKINCQSQQQFGLLNATLSQSIENLKVQATVQGQHALISEGGKIAADIIVQPLQPALPLTAEISLQETTVIALESDSISVAKADINIDSRDMNADIALQGELSFSRWPGTHQLTLAANADSAGQRLLVDELNWQLPEGQVAVNGNLTWAEGLQWTGPVTWQALSLDYWQQFVSGKLSGKMQTDVRFDDNNLVADVIIDTVDGSVNKQTVDGSGRLLLRDQQLAIDKFLITVDKSLVAVDGNASLEKLDVKTRLNIPEIKHWFADAGGAIQSQLQFQGSIKNPKVVGTIDGQNLHYPGQGISAEKVHADVNWLSMESRQNRVAIEATNVQQKEFYGNIAFNWQGSIGDHQWQLTGRGLNQHTDKQLTTSCSGSWTKPVIEARCDRINLAFDYFADSQQWQLSSPLEFTLNTQARELSLSAFCFANGEQSLCNSKNVNLNPQSTGGVTLQANDLTAAWIAPWLPENASIDGTFDATITLENPFTQLVASATLYSDTIAVQWQQQQPQKQGQQQAPITLQVQTLSAGWTWQQEKQQHRLEWEFVTRANGSSRGNLQLTGEHINGELSLRQWQLSAFSRFILRQPRDRIEGEVNSNFKLSGTLNKPLINGSMNIDNGFVKTAALPVPIEKITIDLQVTDNNAKLSGTFLANESQGTLGGDMYWSPEQWNADLSLTAKDLAYKPDSNIQVFVSPDVQLKMSPQRIALTGTVQVPRADVEMEKLPEQAVSVSPDTIVVGSETRQQGQQQVTTNLKLVLGDQVRFTGFGLETRITGNLTIQQNPGELLRGQGVLQLKEGRYQAYGQDLQIRNGDLVFVNDIENPQLRMEAIREPLKTADDVIVGLRVSGPARDPSITIFSEPPMTRQEQMSYLIAGVAPGVQKETDPSQLAAQSALSYALNSKAGEGFTQFAGRALGIDDLQVTTDSNENGTHIGLSGYITPKLLVQYGVGVFDSVNSLTLKYQLKKNLYLEAVSGKGNALGLLWSFEKD